MPSRKSHSRRRHATGIASVPASLLAFAAAAFGLPSFTTSPKSSAGSGGQAEVYAIAAGCHPTFDRFVIRARFATPGYKVRYVSQIVADGSGNVVPLQGQKRIRVTLLQSRAHTTAGADLVPKVLTPHCSNLRQIKVAGDFEGVVTFGLGLRRKRGFRVFRLSAPRRIVVDVAH